MEDTKKSFWDNFKSIFYAIVIALLFRSFIAEPFSIPSGSMIPSLLVGDYLFVSKMSYGYSKHSLPLSMPLIKNRIFYSNPEYGDVIVFKLPSDNKTDYIKRVIGLPGDKIQLKEGRLYINQKLVQRNFLEEYVMRDHFGNAVRYLKYMEILPNGKEHTIIEVSDTAPNDNTEEFTVPEDHFFMMGDNRDNSQDSRFIQVGFVPKNNLMGKAKFLFFSHDDSASWWQFWKWPLAVRWTRLFNGIK